MKNILWLIFKSMPRGTFAGLVFFIIFSPGAVFAAVPVESNNLRGEAALGARYSLISAAEKYLGTPYRYSGIDARGIDCSGLIYASFRDSLKVTVPRSTGGLFTWAEKIPNSELRPGDLLFFATGRDSSITHVAIFTGNGRFIHAASEGSRTGVIYSSLDEAYWKNAYSSAGRALPWDSGAESALAASSGAPGQVPYSPEDPAVRAKKNVSGNGANWSSSNGFFAGGGAAFIPGGFLPGAPSVFRGLAGQIKAGYKGLLNDSFQVAIEVRPEWDQDLGIVRLPLTISLGNDRYQFFAGPALTFGETVLQTGEKYSPAFTWLGEIGFSAAFEPIDLGRGALSFFGEAAWQPYSVDEGQPHSFGSDFTANIRLSIGARYLFLLGER